jgi:hypothetical protein
MIETIGALMTIIKTTIVEAISRASCGNVPLSISNIILIIKKAVMPVIIAIIRTISTGIF